jgi:hypothetical protein
MPTVLYSWRVLLPVFFKLKIIIKMFELISCSRNAKYFLRIYSRRALVVHLRVRGKREKKRDLGDAWECPRQKV